MKYAWPVFLVRANLVFGGIRYMPLEYKRVLFILQCRESPGCAFRSGHTLISNSPQNGRKMGTNQIQCFSLSGVPTPLNLISVH